MRKQYHNNSKAITINVINESVDGGDYGDISIVAYDDKGTTRYGIAMDQEFTPCDTLADAREMAKSYND